MLSPPPITPTTPPSSPLGNLDSYPTTLWDSNDPWVAILHSIGFTVNRWTFPDGLPTWEQLRGFEQQHSHNGSFNPINQFDLAREHRRLCSNSFPLDD